MRASRQVSWHSVISVIDLFAGPGGLGEGFSAYRNTSGEQTFKIVLSIEKDEEAYKTLRLRSFFRQFGRKNRPEEYYACLRRKLSIEDLYKRFPNQAQESAHEAWCVTLGADEFPPHLVDNRIKEGLGSQDNWVLIGGPPCQVYSLVGRSRRIPKDREKYEKDNRHVLYREYLRIIAAHRPPVFVMENVKGILSSKFEGGRIIEKILADLKRPFEALPYLRKRGASELEYELHALSDYGRSDSLFAASETEPSDYIIRCERHGIPQARHRLILLGVRTDLRKSPSKLSAKEDLVELWEAIKDLPKIRSRVSRSEDSSAEWMAAVSELLAQPWLKDGIDREVRKSILQAGRSLVPIRNIGSEFVGSLRKPVWQTSWFHDQRLEGVCNHSSRSHMKEDLWRYFFSACFAERRNRSPKLFEFPTALLPDHHNVRRARDKRELVFADRFRVQVKGRPSTTVTSHIAKDGHYFIHPDPLQCRSLTVREAARLQTFPDNYFFCGNVTAQYQQVGNAVPPLLARQIARVVHKLFE